MLTIPRKTLARNIFFFQRVVKSQQKFLIDDGMSYGEFLAWARSFQHCFDLLNAMTDLEYQALSNRIMKHRSSAVKEKTMAIICFLFLNLTTFAQPQFSSLTDADFTPPATTFDTTVSVTTLPSLIRFDQVSRIWDFRTEVGFNVYFQPKPCGELQLINNGVCRAFTISLPIRYEGIYYVEMKGRKGTAAKARIEVQSSNNLVTAAAKFWKL